MRFADKYRAIAQKNKSLLCVGLDNSDFDSMIRIIEVTHDLVSAYKPNSAFYEAEGASGIETLKTVCEYIQTNYPEIPIILDAKRGDIGNTNEQYAKFAFEYLKVDAITLHPYQGLGALAPFEKYEDKGLIALVKTSNPESSELQDMKLENGKMVWEQVLQNVVERDGGKGQWGVVVGATHPQEMKQARKIVGDMLILVPGVGAQGAKIEDILSSETSHGTDMIINVGRAILQADNPRDEAIKMQKETEKYA
ncbi:orotidine-5'-phosphate decarboxylase [Candidatus Woesebacteria bacterium]|nr:orotidine-5'-phosphate decarboxylase [Candidatus Woesebacteria bacterium]